MKGDEWVDLDIVHDAYLDSGLNFTWTCPNCSRTNVETDMWEILGNDGVDYDTECLACEIKFKVSIRGEFCFVEDTIKMKKIGR